MSFLINPFRFAQSGASLTAETGTFALTGNAAALKRALRMSAATGAFTLTGNDAVMSSGIRMAADTGAFTLTGNDAALKRSLKMAAATGSFTLTGNNATLNYSGTDPHFANVVLLCGFNGVDGATTSADDSNSSHTLTFVGNAQLDTAQAKFGASSLLLDGSLDRVTVDDSTDWAISPSNASPFTIECWVRFNVLDSNNRGIMGHGTNTSSGLAWVLTGASTTGELTFALSTNGSSFGTTVTTSSAGMTTGVWYHIAVDKDSSGKIRVYVDGVMLASATPVNSAMFDSPAALAIGAQNAAGTADMNGWIDEVRITKGVARYASDGGFTPPSSAFPRQ